MARQQRQWPLGLYPGLTESKVYEPPPPAPRKFRLKNLFTKAKPSNKLEQKLELHGLELQNLEPQLPPAAWLRNRLTPPPAVDSHGQSLEERRAPSNLPTRLPTSRKPLVVRRLSTELILGGSATPVFGPTSLAADQFSLQGLTQSFSSPSQIHTPALDSDFSPEQLYFPSPPPHRSSASVIAQAPSLFDVPFTLPPDPPSSDSPIRLGSVALPQSTSPFSSWPELYSERPFLSKSARQNPRSLEPSLPDTGSPSPSAVDHSESQAKPCQHTRLSCSGCAAIVSTKRDQRGGLSVTSIFHLQIEPRQQASTSQAVELDPSADMASSHFLKPSFAQLHGFTNPGKEKAVRAAKDLQVVVNEKVEKRGLPDPAFEFLELIGKGSFGRVFKSKYRPTNQIVAVKIIDVEASDAEGLMVRGGETNATEKLRHEVSMLRVLKENKARNVNVIFDAFEFDHDIWIISEYCPGGSLHTLMKACPEPGLSETYIIPVARELAEALSWVHNVGIVHRDVKPANVLVCEDGRVQLCDFGVAGSLNHDSDKRATFIGTIHYMPLEMLAAESVGVEVSYGKEVDVWSYGCTLYELATGFPPNRRAQGVAGLAGAIEQKVPRLEGGDFSDALRDLVATCLTVRPQDRPPIKTVQQHHCLANSESEYPTASLTQLLEDYFMWEQSGGQRASLFWAGGAAVSTPNIHNETDSDDEWNFSTTERFDRSLATRRASAISLQGETAPRRSPSTGSNTSFAEQRKGSGQAADVDAHPRVPFKPLERLFHKDDNYNYLERSRDDFKSSDLPLRPQNQNSSIRDTMIDLGEFDTETGTAKIPDLGTIRGPQSSNIHFTFDEDEDEEGEPTLKYKASDANADRRATKDWKFPGLGSANDDENKRRATKDWKFPGLAKPAEDENSRRATKDWKFPGLQSVAEPQLPRRATKDWKFPSTVAEESVSSTQRSTAAIDPKSAEPFQSSFGAQSLQETMSAPVSPPQSTIDLGEYIPRPSTADSAPGPLSPEHDPDDPFGYEINSDAGPGNRYSYHKQSRSEPTTLENNMSSSYDVRNPSNDSDGRSLPSRHEKYDAYDSEDSDAQDGSNDDREDYQAKSAWKRRFYSEWTDADLFNPNESVSKHGKAGQRARDLESRLPRHRHHTNGQRHSNDTEGPNQSRPAASPFATSARREFVIERTDDDSDAHSTCAQDDNSSHEDGESEGRVSNDAARVLKAARAHARESSEADEAAGRLLDIAGLERYVAQPAPAPPRTDVLLEGASADLMAEELERLLGGFGEGLGTVRTVLEQGM